MAIKSHTKLLLKKKQEQNNFSTKKTLQNNPTSLKSGLEGQ